MRKIVVSTCAFFVVGLEGSAAFAAAPAYPSQPVRVIVPFTPGGGTDILARALGQHLSAAFKQSVIVDNRPGGNTVIGSEIAAHSAPDGHTLLVQINKLIKSSGNLT